MKLLLALLMAACSAMASDEVIHVMSNSDIGIKEQGKPLIRVDVPVILTPASDFNLEYKTNRVEVTKKRDVDAFGYGKLKRYTWINPTELGVGENIEIVRNKDGRNEIRTVNKWEEITETKTNWTRLEGQWREVGIIVEETKASIVWKGKTNVFTLESKEVGTAGPREIEKPVWTTGGTVTFDSIGKLVLTNVLTIENGGHVP